LGFVDKQLILVGVGGFVCWRRRNFSFAEKIMPQMALYRFQNDFCTKKLRKQTQKVEFGYHFLLEKDPHFRNLRERRQSIAQKSQMESCR
jgi:hypothetical protein